MGRRDSQLEWGEGAIALVEAEEWQGLLDWCQQWTKSRPVDFIAWFNLGLAYSNLGRHGDAIDAYHQTIHIDPEDARAWSNLASAYVGLHRYDDAIEAYNHAVRIDPELFDAWYNLGTVIARDLNHPTNAIEAFNHAIRIDPMDSATWYNLGKSYAVLDRHNEAIDAYSHAISCKS